MRRVIAQIAVTVLVATELPSQSGSAHPLDPLGAGEITSAVSVLRRSGRISPEARFGAITVQPRSKTRSEPRGARMIGYDWRSNQAFVAVVNLAAARVESWSIIGDEPPMRIIIIRRAEEIARADPRWSRAMLARNIDTNTVSVLVSLGERQKLERFGAHRFANAFMWVNQGTPGAMRVPGVTLRLNLTRRTVDRFTDTGTPFDGKADQLAPSTRPALTPLEITQPRGSAAVIEGNQITWDRWRLRVGLDPRRGLEIHDVSFLDGARRRSVLYSGSVAEIVAPYGDPSFGTWYPRDLGDYGMGLYGTASAVAFNDVPSNARFLDAAMHDHLGRPIRVARAIAIYERDGGMLWRHGTMSRRARQLVVSGHATIDNYDYQFNWIFSQDGAIDGEVILSGVMNVNPTSRQRDTAHATGHTSYGHLVAPGINAPNHQHFFSFRLDLDVDGTANTVYELDTRAAPVRANRNGELFTMTERPLLSERAAITDVSFATARSWRVVNTHETNALGQFTGYSLVPTSATPAFASTRSLPVRTAGFVAHQLWATPYSPNEAYAAGEFQNLGRDNEGLPTWTAANRSLRDADVVLWFTMGITHIPRPEDWPYMPAHRGTFRLIPTSFFARNPALDVPAIGR